MHPELHGAHSRPRPSTGQAASGSAGHQRPRAGQIRAAVEPFIAFAKSGSFKLFGDDFVLTNGSRQDRRQLTAGDFRALLAAVGEKAA